jgi:hypothetical protein
MLGYTILIFLSKTNDFFLNSIITRNPAFYRHTYTLVCTTYSGEYAHFSVGNEATSSRLSLLMVKAGVNKTKGVHG